jgi:hypothetical protein
MTNRNGGLAAQEIQDASCKFSIHEISQIKPSCLFHNSYIVFCKSDANNPNPNKRHSIVLVPSDTPGLTVTRPLKVYGFDGISPLFIPLEDTRV